MTVLGQTILLSHLMCLSFILEPVDWINYCFIMGTFFFLGMKFSHVQVLDDWHGTNHTLTNILIETEINRKKKKTIIESVRDDKNKSLFGF